MFLGLGRERCRLKKTVVPRTCIKKVEIIKEEICWIREVKKRKFFWDMNMSRCDEGNENDYEIIIATNLNVDIGTEEEVDLDSNSRNSQLLDSQLLKG